MVPLLLLFILTTLAPVKAKPTSTFIVTYPCLTIATSHQSDVTELRPSLTALANLNAVYSFSPYKIGSKGFDYTRGDEKCCREHTGDYDGTDFKAKLPKMRGYPIWMLL